MGQVSENKVSVEPAAEEAGNEATTFDNSQNSKFLKFAIIVLAIFIVFSFISFICDVVLVGRTRVTCSLEGVEEKLGVLEEANTELLLKLDSQKSVTDSLSESVQNMSAVVTSCPPADEGILYLVGPPSAEGNDAPSNIYCPVGYYAAGCQCDNDAICDGARLYDDDIRLCTALKRFGIGGSVKAMVKCKLERGKEVQVIAEEVYFGNSLACPSGFIMETFSKLDLWSEFRATAYMRSVNDNTVTCSWWSSNTGEHVILSLVCTRNLC